MSSTLSRGPIGDGLDPVQDERAIREQLERILASPAFRNSKRYPNLLRHVVERTLHGQAGDLKERTLGIDVFGRSADYDPASDPVVRVSAGEIRKRIAQYYHEPGHETEILIDLPLGCYVPAFYARNAQILSAAIVPAPAEAAAPPPVESRRIAKVVAIGLGVVVLLAAVWFRPWVAPPAVLDQFWAPVLNPAVPVYLCVGRPPLSPGTIATPEQLVNRRSGVGFTDAFTLARLTGLIQSKGQPYHLRREEQTTFGELQQGPAILVGAFNDAWTLRLVEGMRYSFRQDGNEYWIADQRNPNDRRWKVTLDKMDAEGRPVVREDFALISRFLNPRTGRHVVMVAGLYASGTDAAGRLLIDRDQMAALKDHVPPRWETKNLQIVIGTEVIDRSPGPARVLAAYCW